jgi:hypothetical protein
MSMKALRDAVKKANRDTFDVGTVIRWKASDRYDYAALKASDRYDYAALKAGDGQWYTTARSYNTFVPEVLKFDDLLKILTRSEVSEVAVATAWDTVGPKKTDD